MKWEFMYKGYSWNLFFPKKQSTISNLYTMARDAERQARAVDGQQQPPVRRKYSNIKDSRRSWGTISPTQVGDIF